MEMHSFTSKNDNNSIDPVILKKVSMCKLREMEKNNHPIMLAFLSIFSRAATVT